MNRTAALRQLPDPFCLVIASHVPPHLTSRPRLGNLPVGSLIRRLVHQREANRSNMEHHLLLEQVQLNPQQWMELIIH